MLTRSRLLRAPFSRRLSLVSSSCVIPSSPLWLSFESPPLHSQRPGDYHAASNVLMVRKALQLLPSGPIEVEQVTVFTTRGRKTRQRYIIPKAPTPQPATPKRKNTASLSPKKRAAGPTTIEDDEQPALEAPQFEPRKSQGKVGTDVRTTAPYS